MRERQPISKRVSILEKHVHTRPSAYEAKFDRGIALHTLNEAQNSLNTATIIVDHKWLATEQDESDLLHSLSLTVDALKDLMQLIRTGSIADVSHRTLADIRAIELLKQSQNEE